MANQLENRAIYLAQYIICTKSTIRKAGMVFNISKSTVHNDVSKRLKNISKELYIQVQEVLRENFKQKHLRGGEATKRRFSKNNFNFL